MCLRTEQGPDSSRFDMSLSATASWTFLQRRGRLADMLQRQVSVDLGDRGFAGTGGRRSLAARWTARGAR